MKTKMMAMLAAVPLAAAVLISGCDDLPTPEKMASYANAVGKAAGYACKIAKVKPEVKEKVVEVLDTVVQVVPNTNETFAVAWSGLIKVEVQKLIDSGKLDAEAGPTVELAMRAAAEGLDYVFIKYPKAKDSKELVETATHGFVAGFKSTVKLAAGIENGYDKEAYDYLEAKLSSLN